MNSTIVIYNSKKVCMKPVNNNTEMKVKEEIEIKDESFEIKDGPLENIADGIQFKTESYEEPTVFKNEICSINYFKHFQYSHCICNKSFIENLRRYNGERLYKCSNCKLASTHKRIIEHHLGLGIHTAETPYHCDRLSWVHNGEKPYQCNPCDITFSNNSNLIAHLRTHTGEKIHKCRQCDKAYSYKWSTKTNMKKNTEEKCYPCHLCDQAFVEKTMVAAHLRTHEGRGKKPYQCSKCNKAFGTFTPLQNHLCNRIHTRTKTFKCSRCEKAFSSDGLLIRHLKIHNAYSKYSKYPSRHSLKNPRYRSPEIGLLML